jgi:hypothetical protein
VTPAEADVPLERLEIDAQELVAGHPPRWRDANKRIVHQTASPPGAVHAGRLRYSRWPALRLPESVGPSDAGVEAREGFFDYPAKAPGTMVWHLNFADPHLFAFYAGGLFAQDEMQVAEHPALASLKEALDATGMVARTSEGGRPTPVLVAGVERRCRIATNPDTGAGRSHGLYGNAFARASESAIRSAVTRLAPPTISNIIAMAAPAHGRGRYTFQQCRDILETAWSGFRAATLETRRTGDDVVVVHTGFWGCGAFGGNRVLMTALQLIAARLAGVGLVYFTGSPPGMRAFEEGRALAEAIAGDGNPVESVIDRMVERGLQWGVGDGN